MKRADLAERVRELELEVARLNGVIEGIRLIQPPTLIPWNVPTPLETTSPIRLPYTHITWAEKPGETATWCNPSEGVWSGGRQQ